MWTSVQPPGLTLLLSDPEIAPHPWNPKDLQPHGSKKRSAIKISFLFIAYSWIQISYGQDWWSICLSHNWNEVRKIGVFLPYWARFIHIKFIFFPNIGKLFKRTCTITNTIIINVGWNLRIGKYFRDFCLTNLQWFIPLTVIAFCSIIWKKLLNSPEPHLP